ncbi:MAG: ABC transporter permease [Geminicoccaceae bacterium]
MSDKGALGGATSDSASIEAHVAFRDFLGSNAPVLSIAAFFILVCVVFSAITDSFLTQVNLLNLLRQSAPILIVATAMTFVITTGGIDLSVGSNLALVNALAAITLAVGIPWPAAVLLMLFLGVAIGAVQGYFVAYEGIPAFIVTLAGLSAIRGLALLLTEGYSIPISGDSWFVQIGRGWFLGVPLPAIIALVVAIVGYVVLTQTRYGRYVTGIGANVEAVRRAGVNVRRHILSVYALTGIAAALAGIVIAARLGSGSSNAGVGFELEVIAAVVLGGTNLFGGRGTIVGTALGALTIAVIGNGLILAHISPFFTQIVTGLIILLAIWLNTRLFDQASRLRRR